jgi:hypothetical protein
LEGYEGPDPLLASVLEGYEAPRTLAQIEKAFIDPNLRNSDLRLTDERAYSGISRCSIKGIEIWTL